MKVFMNFLAGTVAMAVIYSLLFIVGVLIACVVTLFFDVGIVSSALIFSSYSVITLVVLALLANLKKVEIGYINVDKEDKE